MQADDGMAARLYAAAVDAGCAQAEMDLALMYEQGRGVPQDSQEALRLYMAAADQGHSDALHRAGCMLEQGCGGQPDFQAALKYRCPADHAPEGL